MTKALSSAAAACALTSFSSWHTRQKGSRGVIIKNRTCYTPTKKLLPDCNNLLHQVPWTLTHSSLRMFR